MSHLTGTFSRAESSDGVETHLVTYDDCYGELSGDIFMTMSSPLTFGAVVAIYSDSTKSTKLFELLVSAELESEDAILSEAITQFAPNMNVG